MLNKMAVDGIRTWTLWVRSDCPVNCAPTIAQKYFSYLFYATVDWSKDWVRILSGQSEAKQNYNLFTLPMSKSCFLVLLFGSIFNFALIISFYYTFIRHYLRVHSFYLIKLLFLSYYNIYIKVLNKKYIKMFK